MQTRAIYPGTFDPITYGHLDLIERAAKMFSHVVIGVAMNRAKQPCFELTQRVQLIEQVIAGLDNVSVVGFTGLLVDLAKDQQATVLIRGVRSTSDFDYELPLANMNRQLYPELETVFLTPKIDNSYISSSLVKDVAAHGGDIRPFCPEIVAQALMAKFAQGK